MKSKGLTKTSVINQKLEQGSTPEEIYKFLMSFEGGKYKTSLTHIIVHKNNRK